jgi:hypothetical protein
MTELMTSAELEEIKQAEQAATPGPWRSVDKGNSVPSHAITTTAYWNQPPINICSAISPKTQDAAFIALSRTAVPRLLAEVSRLLAEVSRLQAALDAEKKRAEAAEGDLKAIEQFKPCEICSSVKDCKFAWNVNGCVLFKWRGPEPGGEGSK